ncbi:hypothetical protein [Nitrosomonas sp. Nm51]|uniref:hypothetical protein n=1 Tax=Nitrosomonas sp. Nm51 TaxID=133720 RepID=UPI0011600852|nr:hypothetical protein [Nitrosomonas sp. Nm51]
MANAVLLTFSPTLVEFATPEWDNTAVASGIGPIPLQHLYKIEATEGATYDIFANSFEEPALIVYDNQGNAIFVNDDSDDPVPVPTENNPDKRPSELDEISDWVAPYTGVFFVAPGWQQGSVTDFVYSLNIQEDIDTVTSNNTDGDTPSSAQIHLATYGVTIQQARDFILSHVDQPATIFNAAKQFGVTTQMLSEITGFSTDVIDSFFASFGMNTDALNGVIAPDIPSGHKLLPENLASLSHLVVFNTNSGILSTDSLRENNFRGVYEPDYFDVFDPNNYQGSSDGVFTAEELGVAHLSNLPATTETLESLIYGTMVNAFRAIGESEIIQIASYFRSHPDLIDNPDTSEFAALMNDVFSDRPADPIYRDDTQLAQAVYQATNVLIDDVIRNDFEDILIMSLIDVTAASMLELISNGRADIFFDSGGVFL